MKQVRLGNTILGDGRVKICLPLVGKNRSEIVEQMYTVTKHEPDVIEFRADWYESVFEKAKLHAVLEEVHQMAGGIPILFTFRSKNEGGEHSISWDAYQELNLYVAQQGLAEAVDVEAFFNYEAVTGKVLTEEGQDGMAVHRMETYRDENGIGQLINRLQQYGVKVIASNHDFEKTPVEEQMLARLVCMQNMGADIAKLAVMPCDSEDVLSVLCTTRKAVQKCCEIPVITMAMGRLGAVTRLSGGLFGSVLTFASAGKTSAPGQIEIEQLRGILNLL